MREGLVPTSWEEHNLKDAASVFFLKKIREDNSLSKTWDGSSDFLLWQLKKKQYHIVVAT